MYTSVNTLEKVYKIEAAKLFTNGDSQAVRLTKDRRLDDSDEVFAKK